MPLESRRIAAFLLTHPDDNAWKRALIDDNILQKKAPATAIRQASLIRKCLDTLDATALEMVAQREQVLMLPLAKLIKPSPRIFPKFKPASIPGYPQPAPIPIKSLVNVCCPKLNKPMLSYGIFMLKKATSLTTNCLFRVMPIYEGLKMRLNLWPTIRLPLSIPVNELHQYLLLAASEKRVLLSDIIDRFTGIPRGWKPEWEIVLLVTRLYRAGEIKLMLEGADIEPKAA